jgi:uncharacterized protein YjbI with pentapeptide repeats
MASAPHVDWETCAVDTCTGSASADGQCLAHLLAPLAPNELRAALKRVAPDRKVDARGVEFTGEFLGRFLDALFASDDERRLEKADFRGATFVDDATFESTSFGSVAQFDEAIFKGDVSFKGATFEADVSFGKATFERHAWFGEATFRGEVSFDNAIFEGRAWFHEASFQDALFGGATFKDAEFGKATFDGAAWFVEASFEEHAGFAGAIFKGWRAWFGNATFKHGAGLHGLAVEVNGARPALRRVAGDLRPRQPNLVADEVHQQRARLQVGFTTDTVDGDRYVHRPSFGRQPV